MKWTFGALLRNASFIVTNSNTSTTPRSFSASQNPKTGSTILFFLLIFYCFFRLKYDCLSLSLLPTVFMGYYNANGRPVNIIATRILVDRDLFEMRAGNHAYSPWHQSACGDILFYRVDKGTLVNYPWEYLCHDFAFFFRKGGLLPYNLLEKYVYTTVFPTPTQDWTSVLNGNAERIQKLFDVCNNHESPMTASARDKVLGGILGVMLRRMEPELWEWNSMEKLFGKSSPKCE